MFFKTLFLMNIEFAKKILLNFRKIDERGPPPAQDERFFVKKFIKIFMTRMKQFMKIMF